MLKKSQKAFTLMELMVVVAIVGVIAAIAFPSYLKYVQSSRRADAQSAVLDLSARLDQYYSDNNTYAGVTVTDLGMSSSSSEGYYTLTIGNQSASTFTATATPKTGGAQASDTECAAFTINELGVKAITGSGSVSTCWK